MMRKFTAMLAAFAFAAATLSPAAADARDRRGHGGYYDGRGHHGRHYRDRDNGDAVAAGVIGLVLGVAVGSMLAQPREPQAQCYDRYQRCSAPPPPPRDYYERGYQDQGYYEDRSDSAYEREYGLEGGGSDGGRYVDNGQCMRTERGYDRQSGRTVTVEVPC